MSVRCGVLSEGEKAIQVFENGILRKASGSKKGKESNTGWFHRDELTSFITVTKNSYYRPCEFLAL
jgi:hypothetical protein